MTNIETHGSNHEANLVLEGGGASPRQSPGHSGNWYVLLWGIDTQIGSLSVGGNLTVRRLPEPISVFDLANVGSAGFREWAVLEPLAGGLRVEVESHADAAENLGYDTLNRVWLMSALLVLRDFGRHLPVAASGYPWSVVAGSVPRGRPLRALPRFRGLLLDYHLRILSLPRFENRVVAEEDAACLAGNFTAFDRLAHDSERFRFALEAAVDWRYQTDLRSGVARIWSGIEALFSFGAELTYRIAVSAASLLESRGPHRTSRFHAIQQLYARCSRIVHGDAVSQDDLVQACSDSFELLRDLLLFAATRGSPPTRDDIDAAIFE